MSHPQDPATTLDSGDPSGSSSGGQVIQLPGKVFMLICALAAAAIIVTGRWFMPIPLWLLAAEVFATILGLFLLGSFTYQLHKNPLTYGMGLVIFATFLGVWWSKHDLFGKPFTGEEMTEWWHTVQHWVLSFHGLDHLVHIDTMLFILGLTFFVSVVAQTRLLETISFKLLKANKGYVLPTVIAITAVVAFASGIFDGVSMIGLTIRTLVIILLLAQAPLSSVRYAVMVCTAVTTICGMWLAYGEPPNLIMKANLINKETGSSYLTDAFFLQYCLPGAILAYLCVAFSLRKKLKGQHISMEKLDVVDANAATVRFLQAQKHGEVLSTLEFVSEHAGEFGPSAPRIQTRVKNGESVGLAMVRENVPQPVRVKVLGEFIDEELATKLDRHYQLEAAGQSPGLDEGEKAVDQVLTKLATRRVLAQRIAVGAMLPFVGLLVLHGFNHKVPLFLASFAGFIVALFAIWNLPKMRKLALHDAKHEFSEYYFLFPLFLSITLLTQVGFFDALKGLVKQGIESLGHGHVAFAQFFGATFLSAILDNNVVADFAARALDGLPVLVIHLFALAQISGYAVGGCWTHIGCAQSVVAYAYIQRDVDARYTPVMWIKEMTPLLVSIFIVLTIYIYAMSFLRV